MERGVLILRNLLSGHTRYQCSFCHYRNIELNLFQIWFKVQGLTVVFLLLFHCIIFIQRCSRPLTLSSLLRLGKVGASSTLLSLVRQFAPRQLMQASLRSV